MYALVITCVSIITLAITFLKLYSFKMKRDENKTPAAVDVNEEAKRIANEEIWKKEMESIKDMLKDIKESIEKLDDKIDVLEKSNEALKTSVDLQEKQISKLFDKVDDLKGK